MKPGTKTRSNGPAPITWYAMLSSPLCAYCVCGCSIPYLPFHCGSRFSANAATPSAVSSEWLVMVNIAWR